MIVGKRCTVSCVMTARVHMEVIKILPIGRCLWHGYLRTTDDGMEVAGSETIMEEKKIHRGD